MKLKDKVTILTGASSGIGYATALAYAKEGATVYAVARRAEKLKQLEEEGKDNEGKIIALSGDVSKEEDCKRVVNEVFEKEGRIDILINNAGIIDDYKSPVSITDEIWDAVMTTNVKSIMLLSREVLPHMREVKQGVILNTTSVGGFNGMRGGLAYVASKHAVVGMTKHIGYSYAKEGIRCVAVAPGAIGTEIGGTVKDPDQHTLAMLMAGQKMFPVMAEPEQIASVFVFLGSEDASFINGTTVIADGGWTAF